MAISGAPKSRPPQSTNFKVGDRVLFHKRIATITAVHQQLQPPLGDRELQLQVKVVDAGGVEWFFPTAATQIEPVTQLLDHLAKEISRDPEPMSQEVTEVHMADLKVGDMFTEMLAFWVIIEELLPDGRVKAVHSGKYIDAEKTFEWKPHMYASQASFRAAFQYGSIPGYTVRYARNHLMEKGSSASSVA